MDLQIEKAQISEKDFSNAPYGAWAVPYSALDYRILEAIRETFSNKALSHIDIGEEDDD